MQDHIIDIHTGIYRVTRDGKVFSQSKHKIPVVGKGMEFTGEFKVLLKEERELSTRINNRGYSTVCFNNTTYMIHRLVAEGYCENPEGKPFVNHIDGNKLNNHCSNLEWCTQAENLKHARDTGLADWKVGHKKTYKSAETRKTCLANLKDKTVLTEEQVRWARQNFIARHPEFGATAMASKFGITTTAMSNAIRGKTFKEIK